MIAVVGCLVIALACQDVDRALGPTKAPPKASVAASPPVLLSLTCTLDRSSTAISCNPAIPSPAAGVSASVIYGSTGHYAQFYPYNLVKDTVAHTWAFTAYVQNLLKQSIGTLDGTTVTGVKVIVTDFHATAGTGSVSVANADGTGTFTAPNQKYFNYNQIVAPNGYTGNKLWKFNVPNTVTAVSMSILFSTDFPAEQNVTLDPPTTIPDWINADSSLNPATDSVSVPFTKRLLKVRFTSTATLADRQLAVALVNGAVVGGRRDGNTVNGVYYVQVPDDGTGVPLMNAGTTLRALPQVKSAFPEFVVDGMSLKPKSGGDWSQWTLSPDTVNVTKKNWAAEMVDSPLAWGCSTGDSTTQIGMVDNGFHSPSDLKPNLPTTSYAFNGSSSNDHATEVASIIAANGNSGSVMAGMMWRASLKIEDASLDTIAPFSQHRQTSDWVALRVAHLGQFGARVVNLSEGAAWKNGYTPHTKNDSIVAIAVATGFMDGLSYARAVGLNAPLPLIVVAAGNFGASADAWWSGLPQLRDSLGDTVLVVGASTTSRSIATFSGTNVKKAYVEILAPGAGVWVLDHTNTLDTISGTSFAAPHVTGVVGMLLSFDPELGAQTTGFGPPELKRLILAGADSSRNPATGFKRTVSGFRFLDAYESLKEASRRSGAPLCGNHVWIAGSSITVQRTTSLAEAIFSDPGFPNSLDVKHGGHRIFYGNDDFTNEIAYDSPTRTWKVSNDPNNPPAATDGGAYNSTFGISHDGDSIVVNDLTDRNTSNATVTYSVHGLPSGPNRVLATLRTGLVSDTTPTCDRLYRNKPTAPCISSDWTGEKQSARIFAAYSPTGGRAVIAISPVRTDGTVASDWALCADSPPASDSLATECRFISYTLTSLDSKLYSISTRTATSDTTSLLTINSAQVQQLGISEDGRELFMSRGELHGVPATGFPAYSNCGYTAYTIATNTFSPLIPSEFACNWLGTVMASPRRIAAARVH